MRIETRYQQALRRASSEVAEATDGTQIIDALKRFHDLPASARTTHQVLNIFGGTSKVIGRLILALIFLALFAAIAIYSVAHNEDLFRNVWVVLFVLPFLFKVSKRLMGEDPDEETPEVVRPTDAAHSVEDLSVAAASKYARLALGMTDTDDLALRTKLYQSFDFFESGIPESRRFVSLATGAYHGDEHSFDYCYFHFRFDVKTDKNNVQTFHRHGLVCDFPIHTSLSIHARSTPFDPGFLEQVGKHILPRREHVFLEQVTGRPIEDDQPWVSPSISFNKSFTTEITNPAKAQKLLKPVLLQAIEDMGRKVAKLKIDLLPYGRLCISFENDAVLRFLPCSFDDLPAFIRELPRQDYRKAEICDVFALVHTFMKYTDNNFDVPLQAERKHGPWNR